MRQAGFSLTVLFILSKKSNTIDDTKVLKNCLKPRNDLKEPYCLQNVISYFIIFLATEGSC